MPKVIKLPKPIGSDGKALSQEEIDALNQEPEYVPVEVTKNETTGTFSVACDFNVVGREEDRSYTKFKAKQLKAFTAEVPEGDDGSERLNEAQELESELVSVFISMAFPADGKGGMILAHNVPDMPDAENQEELKQWFEKGTPLVRVVISAIIAKYDPSSPLAFFKKVLKQVIERQETEKKAPEETTTTEAMSESDETGASGNELEMPPSELQEQDTAGMVSQSLILPNGATTAS